MWLLIREKLFPWFAQRLDWIASPEVRREAWTSALGSTAPGSAEHTAVTPLQCPLHNAAHTPQLLQTQLCSGVAQHGTAQTCPCITISAVKLSQLGMFHWVSRITNLRDQFKTQAEKSSTGFTNWGRLHLWRIWPIFYLANSHPHCKNYQTPNPKTHEERHLGGIKAWTLK